MTASMKKGSVTVETAILLPIMIIGILTLAYLMKIIYFQELTFHGFVNEARKTATEAYIYELEIMPEGAAGALLRIGPQNRFAFESRIRKALLINGEENLKQFRIEEFKYLYHDYGMNDLIRIRLSYYINLRMPIGFIKTAFINQAVLMRAWTGTADSLNPLDFSIMEQEESYKAVYVFPRAGEKYHDRTCSFIASDPMLTLLDAEIRHRFKPCLLCAAADLKDGSPVFCYTSYGMAYHSSECAIVKKYVIEIDVAEAERQGYQRCSKCKGGD